MTVRNTDDSWYAVLTYYIEVGEDTVYVIQ